MRFSLTTLLLVAFWIAALMLVWVRREPWAASDSVTEFERNAIAKISSGRWRWDPYSPDQTRHLLGQHLVSNPPSARLLYTFPREHVSYCNFQFVDNDTIVDIPRPTLVFRRRFPEWWWGHFYRPEVWLALALTVALLWRASRAYRARYPVV